MSSHRCRLESPTKQMLVSAAEGVDIHAPVGGVFIKGLNDIKIQSLKEAVSFIVFVTSRRSSTIYYYETLLKTCILQILNFLSLFPPALKGHC